MKINIKENIVLIGFMGVGKSSVSKSLGKALHKEVVSTDVEIERREGRSVAGIFKESGEAYFRQIEKQIVKKVSTREEIIIDCGGGVVLDQENIDTLKKNGRLIHLSASEEFIHRMISRNKDRPLLHGVSHPQEKIKALLEQRRSKYEQADLMIVSEGKTIDQVTEEIVRELEHG